MKTMLDCLPKGITNSLGSHARRFLVMRKVGCYQEGLLGGTKSWFGADLGGNAAKYASKYRRSAMRLYSDLRLAFRGSNYYPAMVGGAGGKLVLMTTKSAIKAKFKGEINIRKNGKTFSLVVSSNNYLRPLTLSAMGTYLERASDRKAVKNFGKLRKTLAGSTPKLLRSGAK